jgi:hypothetical protein
MKGIPISKTEAAIGQRQLDHECAVESGAASVSRSDGGSKERNGAGVLSKHVLTLSCV